MRFSDAEFNAINIDLLQFNKNESLCTNKEMVLDELGLCYLRQ